MGAAGAFMFGRTRSCLLSKPRDRSVYCCGGNARIVGLGDPGDAPCDRASRQAGLGGDKSSEGQLI